MIWSRRRSGAARVAFRRWGLFTLFASAALTDAPALPRTPCQTTSWIDRFFMSPDTEEAWLYSRGSEYARFFALKFGRSAPQRWKGLMTAGDIDVSVITPSLNMLPYLERRVAAVADQEGVKVEHLVMDGGSRDGTVEWLAARPSLLSEVCRDNGMYEAINRGFRRARGRILGQLNCDEQYLPGTLAAVMRYFDAHPEVDVLYGNWLTVRPDGSLILYRKCIRPLSPILSVRCCAATAATFFRRKLIDDGVFYDQSYKDIADMAWYVRVLKEGYRLAHADQYFATSAITGNNRALVVPTIGEEKQRFSDGMPWWIKRFRYWWLAVYWGHKLLSGCYFQATPLRYAIYTPSELARRTVFVAHKPSFRWGLAVEAAQAARQGLRERQETS